MSIIGIDIFAILVTNDQATKLIDVVLSFIMMCVIFLPFKSFGDVVMKSAIELTCPRCGAHLSIEKDRDVLFCQYCGAKIMLTDENTFTINKNIYQTIHTIDDASITRAETERMVQIHKIELEKKQAKDKETRRKLKMIIPLILAITGIGLMVFKGMIFTGVYLIAMSFFIGNAILSDK